MGMFICGVVWEYRNDTSESDYEFQAIVKWIIRVCVHVCVREEKKNGGKVVIHTICSFCEVSLAGETICNTTCFHSCFEEKLRKCM